jgi:RNA polymerase sigma factor (sigma-70 family)
MPGPPAETLAALDPSVRALLARAHADGRRTYGPLPLSDADHAAGALALARRRLAAHAIPDSTAALADSLERAPGPDVFLAVACERAVPGAWDVFHRSYLPRLRGLGQRQGLGGPAADTLARDLLGELALAPVRGDARTRLGTYLGAGSLFGWLALILVRRIAPRRAQSTVSLDAEAGPDRAPRADDLVNPRSEAREPAASLEDAETVRRVEARLDAAWASLAPRERLILVWKHVDGLSQQDVARRLGVGEPRVSRIVHGALERLRSAALDALDAGLAPSPEAFGRLRDALQRRLATEAALATPPLRRTPPPRPIPPDPR